MSGHLKGLHPGHQHGAPIDPNAPAGGCGPGPSRVPGVVCISKAAATAAHHRQQTKKKHPATAAHHPKTDPGAKTESPIPSVSHLSAARARIMKWVAAEPKPKNEWERLQTANPNDPEHNFRATYAINYALEMVGVRAGKVYAPAENVAHVKQALWKLTEDLRRADQRTPIPRRIGTSEALFLRDAQRYLYGMQGTPWLRKQVEDQYDVPKVIAEHSSGDTIDGVYNAFKKGALAASAVMEKVTGKSPGLGRTGAKKLPLSRPGGDAWFDLGAARYAELHPEAAPAKPGNLLLLAVPALPK